MKWITKPFKWVWYWVLDPRGVKDFNKIQQQGMLATKNFTQEVAGDLIQRKADKRRRKEEKIRKKLGLPKED